MWQLLAHIYHDMCQLLVFEYKVGHLEMTTKQQLLAFSSTSLSVFKCACVQQLLYNCYTLIYDPYFREATKEVCCS